MAVGRNAAAVKTTEIAIPYIQHAQTQGQVVRIGSAEKMRIHSMRALQHISELRCANGNRNRQTNGGPQGKASTDPVPESQSTRHPKLRCRRCVGGQGHKMLLNIGFRAAVGQKPCARRVRIEHGFRRRERFGGDQEQCALRFDLAQHMPQFMPINVRDKVKVLSGLHPVFQRLHHHLRAQVRAANANIDHIRDTRIAAHLLGQRQHGIQHAVHLLQRLLHRRSPRLHHRV